MHNSLFEIRTMVPDDVNQAINLSRAEGWNQTEKDWSLLLGNKSNICLVAEKDKKITGTATALSHSKELAWIGMVLVDKDCRGQGIGKALMINILEKLQNYRSVKLDATPAGLPVYQKLGFIEERIIYRMTNPGFSSFQQPGEERAALIKKADLPEVTEYDRSLFGTGREYLIRTIFMDYPSKAFLVKKNDKMSGYILGRDGSRFHYIGPVIAGSFNEATTLISTALDNLNNQAVALDIFQDKEELIRWLESKGFAKQRQFVRMYLKDNMPGRITSQYLISGPEYG